MKAFAHTSIRGENHAFYTCINAFITLYYEKSTYAIPDIANYCHKVSAINMTGM